MYFFADAVFRKLETNVSVTFDAMWAHARVIHFHICDDRKGQATKVNFLAPLF
jgi:hypothetical protein